MGAQFQITSEMDDCKIACLRYMCSGGRSCVFENAAIVDITGYNSYLKSYVILGQCIVRVGCTRDRLAISVPRITDLSRNTIRIVEVVCRNEDRVFDGRANDRYCAGRVECR